MPHPHHPDSGSPRADRVVVLLTSGFPLSPVRLRVAAAAAAALTAVAAIGLATVTPPSAHPRAAAPTSVSASPSTSPVALPSPTPTTARPTPRRTTAPAVRLRGDTVAIPRQHVVAPVDTCRILDGGLEPPADVRRACYWAGGSRLDAVAGTTVITGHVNWAGQGTGALGNIDRLRPGDLVLTAGRAVTGRVVTSTWRVAAVWHRPKTRGIDTTAFVGHAGPRTLYLITCGGSYDSSELSYRDNIYVRAVPASSPPATTPTSVHAG